MTGTFWDQRFAERGFAYGEEPNVFLSSRLDELEPGSTIVAVMDRKITSVEEFFDGLSVYDLRSPRGVRITFIRPDGEHVAGCLDGIDRLFQFLVILDDFVALEGLETELDSGEGVADFVGHPGGE